MSVLIFFIVLVLLILVHELGHFIVAKKSGIRVDEFGIGFPPKLFGKKIGETEYTVNLLPIGGFVRIWGEDPDEAMYENPEEHKRSFVAQPRYIQALVLVAGVTMNILLAFVLYTSAYIVGIPTAVETRSELTDVSEARLLVSSIVPDSPADTVLKASDEIVGLTAGDTVFEAPRPFEASEVSAFISASEGPVTFEVERRGELLSFTIEPKTNVLPDSPERRAVGFSMALVGVQSYPLHRAILEGAQHTFYSLYEVVVGLSSFLLGIITGDSDFSQVTGPVGIVGLVGDAAALGFVWLLTFSAFISLNLAVINLLPFPALDGGRIVFVAIESITRKPIPPMLASRVNQIGFIFLLMLMAIVTFKDILDYFHF